MKTSLSGRNPITSCLLYSLFLHFVVLYLFLTLPLIKGMNYTSAFEMYFVYLKEGERKTAALPRMEEKEPPVEERDVKNPVGTIPAKRALKEKSEATGALGDIKKEKPRELKPSNPPGKTAGPRIAKPPVKEAKEVKKAAAAGSFRPEGKSGEAKIPPPPAKKDAPQAAGKSFPLVEKPPLSEAVAQGAARPAGTGPHKDSAIKEKVPTEEPYGGKERMAGLYREESSGVEKNGVYIPGVSPEKEVGDIKVTERPVAGEKTPEGRPPVNEKTSGGAVADFVGSGVSIISSGVIEKKLEPLDGEDRTVVVRWVDKKRVIKPPGIKEKESAVDDLERSEKEEIKKSAGGPSAAKAVEEGMTEAPALYSGTLPLYSALEAVKDARGGYMDKQDSYAELDEPVACIVGEEGPDEEARSQAVSLPARLALNTDGLEARKPGIFYGLENLDMIGLTDLAVQDKIDSHGAAEEVEGPDKEAEKTSDLPAPMAVASTAQPEVSKESLLTKEGAFERPAEKVVEPVQAIETIVASIETPEGTDLPGRRDLKEDDIEGRSEEADIGADTIVASIEMPEKEIQPLTEYMPGKRGELKVLERGGAEDSIVASIHTPEGETGPEGAGPGRREAGKEPTDAGFPEVVAEIHTPQKLIVVHEGDYTKTHDEVSSVLAGMKGREGKIAEDEEKKKRGAFFPVDLKIEFFMEGPLPPVRVKNTLYKKPHPMSSSEGKGKSVVEAKEEKGDLTVDKEPWTVRVFTVPRAEHAAYEFVVENTGDPGRIRLVFSLYETRAWERVKEYEMDLSSGKVIIRFLVPEGVFWDDEDQFTGMVDGPDTVTKFNDETGLVWREDKLQ